MFRNAFSVGANLLLVGAVVLVAPSLAHAQRRGGGGHVGGAHAGNAHGGGYRGGVYHGGINRGGVYHGGVPHSGVYRGGVYHGGSRYGYHPGYRYGYGARSYPRYYGYRYPRYYGSYGAWPYNYSYYPSYGNYDYYPDSYAAPSYDWSSPAYDSGYYGSYGDVTPPYLDTDPNVTAQADTRVQITVTVPVDAQLWFEGTATTSSGPVRVFHSPPLQLGKQYVYEVRARWTENGQEVNQTQQVQVAAGSRVQVHFPLQATMAPRAPSQ